MQESTTAVGPMAVAERQSFVAASMQAHQDLHKALVALREARILLNDPDAGSDDWRVRRDAWLWMAAESIAQAPTRPEGAG